MRAGRSRYLRQYRSTYIPSVGRVKIDLWACLSSLERFIIFYSYKLFHYTECPDMVLAKHMGWRQPRAGSPWRLEHHTIDALSGRAVQGELLRTYYYCRALDRKLCSCHGAATSLPRRMGQIQRSSTARGCHCFMAACSMTTAIKAARDWSGRAQRQGANNEALSTPLLNFRCTHWSMAIQVLASPRMLPLRWLSQAGTHAR